MPRKTADISVILKDINRTLQLPENDILDTSSKRALCNVIERVLMDAGAYKGFMYIDPAPLGEKTHPAKTLPEYGSFAEYTRHYFLHPSLRD
jgi:hypothetical protein